MILRIVMLISIWLSIRIQSTFPRFQLLYARRFIFFRTLWFQLPSIAQTTLSSLNSLHNGIQFSHLLNGSHRRPVFRYHISQLVSFQLIFPADPRTPSLAGEGRIIANPCNGKASYRIGSSSLKMLFSHMLPSFALTRWGLPPVRGLHTNNHTLAHTYEQHRTHFPQQ